MADEPVEKIGIGERASADIRYGRFQKTKWRNVCFSCELLFIGREESLKEERGKQNTK